MLGKAKRSWHGTPASKTGVCKANEWAPERLLGEADVYLLSWVRSKARKVSTLQEVEALAWERRRWTSFGSTYQKQGFIVDGDEDDDDEV